MLTVKLNDALVVVQFYFHLPILLGCVRNKWLAMMKAVAFQFAYDALCSSAISYAIFAHTGCILQAASRIAAGVAKTSLTLSGAHANLAGL